MEPHTESLSPFSAASSHNKKKAKKRKKKRKRNSLLRLKARLQLPKTIATTMTSIIRTLRKRVKTMASLLRKTKKRRKRKRTTVATTLMTGRWKMLTGVRRTAMASKKSSRRKKFRSSPRRRSLSQLLKPFKGSTGNIGSERRPKKLITLS